MKRNWANLYVTGVALFIATIVSSESCADSLFDKKSIRHCAANPTRPECNLVFRRFEAVKEYAKPDASSEVRPNWGWGSIAQVYWSRALEAPSGWVPIWAGDHRDPRLYSWIETKELALLSDFKRVVGCWPIQHIYDEVGDAALDAAFTTDGVVYLSGKRKAHVFFAPNVIYILGPGTEGGYILYGYDPKTRRLHEPTNGRSPEKVQYHPEEKLRGCRGELRLDAAETGP